MFLGGFVLNIQVSNTCRPLPHHRPIICYYWIEAAPPTSQVPGKTMPEVVDVPILLPHEILDALWRAGSLQEGFYIEDFLLYPIGVCFCVSHPTKKLEIFLGNNANWLAFTKNTTPEFEKSMTGPKDRASIAAFWRHCGGLEEWCDHPCLNNDDIPLDSV